MSEYKIWNAIKERTISQLGISLINFITGKSWRDPCSTPYVVVDMCDLWQHARNNLDATRPISNHGDSLVLSSELASQAFYIN